MKMPYFTRATSQSPCLNETLATAAIAMRNPRSGILIDYASNEPKSVLAICANCAKIT